NRDADWRASNYLSVGQMYLLHNPLLKESLRGEHIKPRLLGHWGTSPGLNMLCVHLNRVIKRDDLNVIYIIGPGHGGPSLVAHAYLEGTYSEVYPNISLDTKGMKKLFKLFSFPGGLPSLVALETPGGYRGGGNQSDLVVGPQELKPEASRLADDRLPHAEGVDLSAGNRRQEVRGLLAQPPGADGRHGQAGPHPHPRTVDEELPAGGVVR